MTQLRDCIERGTSLVSEQLQAVARYTADISEVSDLLDPEAGTARKRRCAFDEMAAGFIGDPDPIYQHMGRTMLSFASGLFAGGDDSELPQDNLDLERAFRLPKSHERRIHGRAHAGVRIVQQGPSLILVLDAHARHPEPFASEDLVQFADATLPPEQLESEQRRRIMRLARSTKRRPALLATLESRYITQSQAP